MIEHGPVLISAQIARKGKENVYDEELESDTRIAQIGSVSLGPGFESLPCQRL
jgi:hypothetical protein